MAYDPEEIRMETARALERWRETQQKLADLPDEVGIGQLFLYTATADMGVEWAVVHQHPDDPQLWFCLPFDQEPLVGTWDVAVSELSESGPGVLRCGRGIWIHREDLRLDDRGGQLEQKDTDAARKRIADLVEGNPVTIREEVDCDPDYQDWMDALTEAVDKLETQLHSAPGISLANLNQDWINEPGIHMGSTAALAARSDDLGAPPADMGGTLPGIVIPANFSGKLVVVREPEGLRLQYHCTGTESPPAVVVKSVDHDQPVEWRQVTSRFHESQSVFAPDARVEISWPDGGSFVLVPECS